MEEPIGDAHPIGEPVPADVAVNSSNIRATPEYAAAFDLEVWKAEHRKQFEASLAADLERKHRELELLFAQRDVDRLEEVDTLRRELEAMAKRLNATGKVLAKRIANLEAREEAFEARRLQLATDSEHQYRELEGRHRRAMDEQFLKYEGLTSQIKERSLVTQQTQQRLVVLQQEYDSLQRLVTKLQSRETSEAATIAELRHRSETMAGTIRELQATLERKSDDLNKHLGEKEELIAACRLYKEQLHNVTAQYSDLVASVHAQREQMLAEEQRKLAAAARHDDLMRLHMHHGHNVGTVDATAHLSPSGYLAKSYVAPGSTTTRGRRGSAAGSEVAALRDLVQELQHEAEREAAAMAQEKRRRRRDKKQREDRRRPTTSEAAVRYAEPRDAARLHYQQHNGNHVVTSDAGVPQRSVSPLRVTGSVGEVLFGELSPYRDPDRTAAYSPPNDGEGRVASDHRRVVEIPFDDARNDDRDDDDAVSLSTLSSHTAALRRSANEVSAHDRRNHWHQQDQNKGGLTQRYHHDDSDDEHDVDDDPNLSVATSGGGRYTYVSALSDTTGLRVSGESLPTSRQQRVRPAESVRESSEFQFTSTTNTSVRFPSAGPTTTTTTSSSDALAGFDLHAPGALPEIRAFVDRLKENRDRLIETGVYSIDDDLMKDMSKKIRVYEHYLKAHFQ